MVVIIFLLFTKLDTFELYKEPIVLFTVLCNIAKSCMPRTTAKQKKRKPWFNTEC